jgi:hypothetical protein
MTASNHAATGALVAAIVRRPELAIPLAFLSHFVLDSLPHFGIDAPTVQERNSRKLFWRILAADMVMALILLIVLPIVLHQRVAWWISFSCIFVAMSPDLVWGWRLLREMLSNPPLTHGLFSKFHAWIQWGEFQWGMTIEAGWLLLTLLFVGSLT